MMYSQVPCDCHVCCGIRQSFIIFLINHVKCSMQNKHIIIFAFGCLISICKGRVALVVSIVYEQFSCLYPMNGYYLFMAQRCFQTCNKNLSHAFSDKTINYLVHSEILLALIFFPDLIKLHWVWVPSISAGTWKGSWYICNTLSHFLGKSLNYIQ